MAKRSLPKKLAARRRDQFRQEVVAKREYDKSFSGGLGLSDQKSSVSKLPSYRRDEANSKIPSMLETENVVCDTTKKDSPVYTGDKLIGIGMMHKSNLVPIFSKEEAIETATMRRS